MSLCVYRQQRMAELKSRTEKARFGDVREITAVDYVQEVNKAGEGIMVVLHLYKQVTTSAESSNFTWPVPLFFAVLRIRDVYSGSRILKQLQKRELKKISCHTFLYSHKFNK
jgi:hypothetical protein